MSFKNRLAELREYTSLVGVAAGAYKTAQLINAIEAAHYAELPKKRAPKKPVKSAGFRVALMDNGVASVRQFPNEKAMTDFIRVKLSLRNKSIDAFCKSNNLIKPSQMSGGRDYLLKEENYTDKIHSVFGEFNVKFEQL
jgi:hypothetical protein